MELLWFLLFLLGAFLVAFLLYAFNGPGALIARSTRSPAPHQPRQLTASPLPSPSLAHGPGRAAGVGFSKPDQLATIDAFYNNDLNAVAENIAALVPRLVPPVSLKRVAFAFADKVAQLRRRLGDDDAGSRFIGDVQREFLEQRATDAFGQVEFQRSLVDMSDQERATLRLADMLATLGVLERDERLRIRVPLIWNEGKCLLSSPAPFDSADRLSELRDAVATLIRGHFGDLSSAKERLQSVLRAALLPGSALAQGDRDVLERYLFGGAKWMTPQTAATALAQTPPSPAALHLGWVRNTRIDFVFDRDESLITIGPPGQGKSQLLMRNLLMLKAGAVVIDIKGELYARTAAWRAEHVGPVYRFIPSEPDNSIRFNPFDTIRPNTADAFDDVQTMLELLMVPKDDQKPDYWDKRGLALLGDAMFDVAEGLSGSDRNMQSVFDRLTADANPPPGGEPAPGREPYLPDDSEMAQWARTLEASNIRRLVSAGKSIRNMPPKARDSVFETARTHADMWQSPRMEALTADTTFNPDWLRRERPATLYICVSKREMGQYATVIRTLLGMTLNALYQHKVTRRDLPVTFFLDEMPQLKKMDVLQAALDTARGHKVRLWMFAQNFGQLQELYSNPTGFIKSSMVRQYMGIEGADALKFTGELGERHGLLDGRRRPLVEPHQLYGEEFRDLVLTCAQGYDPAMLEKTPAYADPAVSDLMTPE